MLDSTLLGVTVMDIYININQTDFTMYRDYVREHPVPRPPSGEFGSAMYMPQALTPEVQQRWYRQVDCEVCDGAGGALSDGDHGLGPWAHDPLARVRPIGDSRQMMVGYSNNFQVNNQQERSKPLVVAVFGTHATLSLEPVHMLRNFVFQRRQVKPVFYGLEERWCKLMGMCDRGDPAFAKFFKDAEQDPYDFPWSKMEEEIDAVYLRDENLQQADLLLCTEPLVGCLLLQRAAERFRAAAEKQQGQQPNNDNNDNFPSTAVVDAASARSKRLPMVAYLGVALLNSVPPLDLEKFWDLLDSRKDTVIYVNNRILREQIYYQTGIRAPYVRSHGLYTDAVYSPRKDEVLFWRAPLFSYPMLQCAIYQFYGKMQDVADAGKREVAMSSCLGKLHDVLVLSHRYHLASGKE